MEMTFEKLLASLKDKTITLYGAMDVKIARARKKSNTETTVTVYLLTSDPTGCTYHYQCAVDVTHDDFSVPFNNETGTRFLQIDAQRAFIRTIISKIIQECADAIRHTGVKNVIDAVSSTTPHKIAAPSTNTINAAPLSIDTFCETLKDQSFKYDGATAQIHHVHVSPEESTGPSGPVENHRFVIQTEYQGIRFDVSFIGIHNASDQSFDMHQKIDKHLQYNVMMRYIHALADALKQCNVDPYIERLIISSERDAFHEQ